MDDTLRITLIANAGVLLRYRGSTLLIDGIQNSENLPFSALPDRLWQELLCGSHRFPKIGGLLFSHLHPDHFSCPMTAQYLKRNPDLQLFMPAEPLSRKCLADSGFRLERTVLLFSGTEGRVFRLSPDITVQAFRTRHLDRRFYGVPHYCYLISFGSKHVLFTADIDYTSESLSQTAGICLHAAFVNPLFFHTLSSGTRFPGKLCASHICVYHVPFAQDDQWGTRDCLEKDRIIWDCRNGIPHTLTEPMQELIL